MNWIYEERCSGIAITDGKEDETIIAMIIPDNDEDECSDIQEANAKLLAAAPQLLSSLEDTYRDLLSELPMSLRCTVKWQANLSHMRHVLAKAKGMNEQDYEYSITQGRVKP